MRVACFDCFSGISGDMILGALLHLGLDETVWREAISSLSVPGYEILVRSVSKQGITGFQVDVVLHQTDQGHGRHLSDIREIVASASLTDTVKQRVLSTFTRLAEAEAKIHGSTIEEIHFHEVGAVDAIVDIVGACLGIEMLRIDKVYASPLPLTRGWAKCMHGQIPVPAPATLELLSGFSLRPDDRHLELITPTGAALIAEFSERNSDGSIAAFPLMQLEKVGYGAGTRDTEIPNLLRVMLGRTS